MPVKKDLFCYRGQTWTQNIYFKQHDEPIDLTGVTFRSQVRPEENSETLSAEFTVHVDGAAGKVSLVLPDSVTAAFLDGVYYWDLKATDDGEVKYWVRGKFIVSGRVTE